MSKHIDYEAEAKHREWWLNNTGGAARDGLTVRDYFAAKAMIGLLSNGYNGMNDEIKVSEYAYIMADAMMKERAK